MLPAFGISTRDAFAWFDREAGRGSFGLRIATASVSTLGYEATRGHSGRIVGEVRAAIVERVRGAVDDGHDQWAIVADPATAQGGLHPSMVPAALTGCARASL